MPGRAAKFASAVLASLLASTPLTTASYSATETVDKCLSGPQGAPPAGGHWYYRVERITKRHCWYVADEQSRQSRAAANEATPAADITSTQQGQSIQRSLADAHAELTAPSAHLDPSHFAGQRPPLAGSENDPRGSAGNPGAQLSLIASRWPDLSGTTSSTSLESGLANSLAKKTTNATPPPELPTEVVKLATADSSSGRQPDSIQTLLLVIVGALAVAGLLGAAILRFGRARHARLQTSGRRRIIWDSVRTDHSPQSIAPYSDRPGRTATWIRRSDGAYDPSERIAQMLARLSRSTAT